MTTSNASNGNMNCFGPGQQNMNDWKCSRTGFAACCSSAACFPSSPWSMPATGCHPHDAHHYSGAITTAIFSFLYLKKQNFKNICLFWKISKIPLVVIFFSNLQRGPWPKKMKGGPVAHLTGDSGLSPTPGGDRVPPPYIRPGRHSLVIWA